MNKRPLLNNQEATSYSSLNTKRTKLSRNSKGRIASSRRAAFCDDIVEVILSFLGNNFKSMVLKYSLISKQWLNIILQYSKLDVENFKYPNINYVINSQFCNNVHSLEWNNFNPKFIKSFKNICQLANLKILNLRGDVGDTGAEHISKLPNLISLHIANSCITRKGAACISQMPNLTSLNISYNNIGNTGAGHIAQMKNLTILNICYTCITRNGIDNIYKMKNLTHLGICSDSFQINSNISQLDALHSLTINYDQIGDQGIEYISKLKNLRHLNIHEDYEGESENKLQEKLIHLNITRSKRLFSSSYLQFK